MKKIYEILIIGLILIISHCSKENLIKKPTQDNGEYFFLPKNEISDQTYHTNHYEIFGKYVTGFNDFILKGIDKAQASAPDGGGYFTGKTAVPTESPIGYELSLFDRPLLDPPRPTSYCSGASYTAFIEGLNLIFNETEKEDLDYQHYEAMRMQEVDGSRRNDGIKYWGHWNADGFGSHFALVQYSGMGKEIKPENARPGDFVNISWKSGLGHSVVFLGWYKDDVGKNNILYWSSQKSTNGMGDQIVSMDKVKEVKIVRLTSPQQLFSFDTKTLINTNVKGDPVSFQQ